MDCAERVQAAVSQVDGVDDAQVDFTTGTLTVWLARPDMPTEQIAQAVRAAGYTLVAEHRREGQPFLGFARFVLSKRETTLATVAGLLTLLGLALAAASAPPWSRTVSFAAAILVGGYPVARHALQELWLSRNLGINALMVIAIVGAALDVFDKEPPRCGNRLLQHDSDRTVVTSHIGGGTIEATQRIAEVIRNNVILVSNRKKPSFIV